MKAKMQNNMILKKVFLKMLPASLAYSVFDYFTFIIDTFLSGFTLGAGGIAAVAIGIPAYTVGFALIGVIINGSCLQMTWKLGKADNNAFNRDFSCCITFALTAGFIISAVLFVFSRAAGILCGASNADPVLLNLASIYIRWSAPLVLIYPLAVSLSNTAGLLGFQKIKAVSSIANVISNIIISTVLIFVLPENEKLAGLGIGTTVAAIIQTVILLIFFRNRKLNIKFRPAFYKFKEFTACIKSGLPASCDIIFEGLSLAFINNIVLMFYPGDTLLLSVVSVVDTIFYFGRCGCTGTAEAARYLFGILYSGRDKDGLISVLKNAFKYGTIVSVCWSAIIVISSPFLSSLFSMSGEPMIQRGLLISLLFTPAMSVVCLLTRFYESTERFSLSLFCAVLPDSVFYPCLMLLFIPAAGTDGIWISMGGAFLAGLSALYALFMIKEKKILVPAEKILCLRKQIITRSPQLDVTIKNTDCDVCSISEKIYDYLNEHNVSRRTAYISSLATEEIAADVAANSDIISKSSTDRMDIKIFVDEDTVEIVIRIFGESYNPLNYDTKTDEYGMCGVKLAAQISDKINYSYVYKLNIVTVTLKK